MTLDEWFDKFFAPEYLNVQHPGNYKSQAKAELQVVLGKAPAPAPTTPVTN